MFSKGKASDGVTARNSTSRAVPSLISADLEINGNLISQGEMQIDGTVNGDVRAKVLAIGERAVVTGEVVAEEVAIRGIVTGRIRARRVELGKAAKVNGDIWHTILSVEPGAVLDGFYRHMADPLAETVTAGDNGVVVQALAASASAAEAAASNILELSPLDEAPRVAAGAE